MQAHRAGQGGLTRTHLEEAAVSLFEVDSDRVLTTAANAAVTAGELSAQSDALMAQLRSLADSWKGAAAQGFQTVAEEWAGVNRHVQDSLRSINEALRAAGLQYEEVEAANTRLFNP